MRIRIRIGITVGLRVLTCALAPIILALSSLRHITTVITVPIKFYHHPIPIPIHIRALPPNPFSLSLPLSLPPSHLRARLDPTKALAHLSRGIPEPAKLSQCITQVQRTVKKVLGWGLGLRLRLGVGGLGTEALWR